MNCVCTLYFLTAQCSYVVSLVFLQRGNIHPTYRAQARGVQYGTVCPPTWSLLTVIVDSPG